MNINEMLKDYNIGYTMNDQADYEATNSNLLMIAYAKREDARRERQERKERQARVNAIIEKVKHYNLTQEELEDYVEEYI